MTSQVKGRELSGGAIKHGSMSKNNSKSVENQVTKQYNAVDNTKGKTLKKLLKSKINVIMATSMVPGVIFCLSVLSCVAKSNDEQIINTCVESTYRVAIDVGHSLVQPGAISARGVPEFNFNQSLSLILLQLLRERGFQDPITIGASGVSISLAQRVAIANASGADLFVSIHHDSVQPRYFSTWTFNDSERQYSDRFSGYSIFVSGLNPRFEDSVRFASLLGRSLQDLGRTPSLHHSEPIEGENRKLIDRRLGIYRWDGLAVTRTTRMPAALLEAGIILNRREERKLSNPRMQMKTAESIVGAIDAFCAIDKARADSAVSPLPTPKPIGPRKSFVD